jgi:hypothetical protein
MTEHTHTKDHALRYAALILLLLPLAACSDPEPPPSLRAIDGRPLGVLHDGTEIKVSEGSLKGRALVVAYFATW